MNEDRRSKQYSSIKYGLSIIETLYLLALLIVFLRLNQSRHLADAVYKVTPSNKFAFPLYLLIISSGYYILNFPFNFYQSYLLERKFSLSNQKIKDWIGDQVKANILAYIIAIILISAFYYILSYFSNIWWIVISIFWIFFSLILARLTPTIIIPLFFKYKKFSDENLKNRIMNLAVKMKVKILDCFEIDFSKKTLKANAAFVGWGRTKRVILADTLKDKYTYDEIEVILAHEFAHYRLKHLLKLILVNSIATISTFFIIFISNGRILGLFGLTSLSDIAALPVIFLYFLLFGIIAQPIENFVSRRLERNADIMALETTGLKEAFVSMMEKLAAQNLADKNPHPLIKFYFFNHPPIEERIDLAKEFKS